MRLIFLSLIFAVPVLSSCTMDEGREALTTAKNFVLDALPDEVYTNGVQAEPHIVAEAFREALTIGSDAVTTNLGSLNGFYDNPAVRIPLPDGLQRAANVMDRLGLTYLSDDLVRKMNRAAETATPHARELFINAVSNLTFADVMTIYNGPNDSATRYFESVMAGDLAARLRPHIDRTVGQEGVVLAYNRFMDQVAGPLNLNFDITDYVLGETIGGIFTMIAKKEAAIRTNPAEQTSTLLKEVFDKREGFVNRAIDRTVTGANEMVRQND